MAKVGFHWPSLSRLFDSEKFHESPKIPNAVKANAILTPFQAQPIVVNPTDGEKRLRALCRLLRCHRSMVKHARTGRKELVDSRRKEIRRIEASFVAGGDTGSWDVPAIVGRIKEMGGTV